MSTFTITIDRTSLALEPLVLHGDSAGEVGVVSYTEPAMQARITYAPDSPHMAGSVPLAATWQQTVLGFDFVTDRAATEAESRAQVAEILQAIGQFRYDTTVVVDGATPETWRCDMGSMVPAGPRGLTDLQNHNPVWQASLPCNPIRSYA